MEIDARGSEKSLSFCYLKIDNIFCVSRLTREGSGSLLLNAKKYSNQSDTVSYYGQEINTSTYNLARMNMMLHGVAIENQHLSNADTLDADLPTDEPINFDGVLMNPPYSLKWSATAGFLTDPRFSSYGVLAPKSKADFAFYFMVSII